MTSFIHKKLSSNKSVAEIIRQERQKKKLTLGEVAEQLQISLPYLEKLEAGEYHKLPGEVYLKQFIKKLAHFYNFSEKKILTIYQKERDYQLNFFRPTPLTIPRRNILSFLTPKFIKISVISLLIASLFGYLAWEVKNIFTPPFLEINSPPSQTITQNPTITITGKTQPEVSLLINNQEILIKPDGSFSQEVNLNIGLNLFAISASKKHSKEKVINLTILRQPSTASDLSNVDRFLTFK